MRNYINGKLIKLPRSFRIWWGKRFIYMLGKVGTKEFYDDITLYNELLNWVEFNKSKRKKKINHLHYLLDDALPFYFPKNRRFSDKLHLAIWNCGMRPQTTLQAFKDVRITIRKNNEPIFVIKKGSV